MFGLLDWIKIGSGAVVRAALVLGPAYFYGKSVGKAEVVSELKDDRIGVLKDGKKIDAEVFNRDDAPLCSFLAGASCQTTAKLTEPCDVLVRIDPKPATNRFLIANDRETAQNTARHRSRYQQYRCGEAAGDQSFNLAFHRERWRP